MSKTNRVSKQDQETLRSIRKHVNQLYQRAGSEIGSQAAKVLEIAPQIWEGAKPFLSSSVTLITLDIDPKSGADLIGDVCDLSAVVEDESFDFVICTEVLEHVSNPFEAMRNLFRVLRPGGRLYASSPFDFRIHGPLPDNWRFSEHGWRELGKQFSKLEILALENPERFLMPIHYNVIADK